MRFDYIRDMVEQITSLPKFTLRKMFRSKIKPTWEDILRWWLNPQGAAKRPDSREVADWHKYVNDNFNYKFNWGLGSIISIAMDDAHGGVLNETSLEGWPKTGLPWVVFWMKELIVWGTLAPVVAGALAQALTPTRRAGEEIARLYYQEVQLDSTENSDDDLLNASRIRSWLAVKAGAIISTADRAVTEKINVSPERLQRRSCKLQMASFTN